VLTQLVLVTAPEYNKGREVFESLSGEDVTFISAPDEEDALAETVRGCGARVVIIGVRKYEGPLYEALPPGGLIARFGVGHDGVDKALAASRGILVTNTPGVLDVSVAEHAMGLVCALARGAPRLSAGLKAGDWAPERGVELRGKLLALVGFGRIAKETARIAAMGFGMDILACDMTPPAAHAQFLEDLSVRSEVRAAYTTSLEEALGQASFVSLHVPLLESTRGLIGARQLALMRPDAFLVNTSRGGIVDEDALFDALAEGRLAGAALDVFENEPYAPRSPGKDLRTLANAVLTPHVSSNTDMANRRMAERCVANVRALLEGRLEDLDRVG
jgi:lactate dehydrogenase-like 2-hydroxyacid dehydrogenase